MVEVREPCLRRQPPAETSADALRDAPSDRARLDLLASELIERRNWDALAWIRCAIPTSTEAPRMSP